MSCAINRRQLLLGIIGAGGAVAGGLATSAGAEEHPAHPVAPPDAVAMLYDSTICTGCRACMTACSEANGLPPDTTGGVPPDTSLTSGIWDIPVDLNSETKNIIKLYKDPGGEFAFVKRQCMHCLDPACVTGCPFGALKKGEWGAVRWNSSLCIGCRYCEVACPFDVPKFEWGNWNPKIVKCEFCFDQRLKKNEEPACTAVCPTGAVIFGKRTDLLSKAKERVADAPDKYFENRVYGEYEAGGTQVLYLSSVSFEKIGLPKLGSTSLGHYATKVTSVIYKWLSGPILVAGLLGAVIKRNWNRHEAERIECENVTGLKDQL
ncbi:MAG TPA: hydrogenase 2 operon protein HybA [Terriglobales bacterium]|nr:hydrogenase 2 operon protein HybA [Dongiaceae bacterium]HVO64587.1 hydrogenase 2 operon protein HybA [Terriglobales bacterium]